MKIQKLTNGLIVALVLASPIAGAKDYPAANFEPTVIYNDSDYKHTQSSSVTSSNKAETSKADPKYPAANFQPEVLFSDANYKHNKSVSVKSAKSSASASVSSESSEVATEESSAESMTTLFGLIALAIVGFVLFKKKSGDCPKKAAKRASRVASSNTDAAGETGVARYLNKNMPKLSSVAKYLENKEKTPVSGVSKYVARKVIAAKAAAESKTTGVEKYLRNKG